MPVPHVENRRDKSALMVGSLLIAAVGAYFIGKNIYFGNVATDKASGVTNASGEERVPLIAPDILLKKMQNGDLINLVDVRNQADFEREHLAQALSLPIGSLENFSPMKDAIAIIIFSENDTATFEAAKNILSKKSFTYFFLKGGFEGWKSLNAPVVSFGDPNSFEDQSKVTYLSVEECKKLLLQTNPAYFTLDVQSEDNFSHRHLKGAVNIPLDQLEKRVSEIPTGRQIIVYGENDLVSFQGGVRLSDLGIFSAHTLTGGQYLSPQSGLPLE